MYFNRYPLQQAVKVFDIPTFIYCLLIIMACYNASEKHNMVRYMQ